VKTRYVVHDLRRTAASVLLRRTPLPEVGLILGHAGPHVTAAVYAHLVPRGSRAALEDVEAYYEQLTREADEVPDPATLRLAVEGRSPTTP
jgi:hypothetical protein